MRRYRRVLGLERTTSDDQPPLDVAPPSLSEAAPHLMQFDVGTVEVLTMLLMMLAVVTVLVLAIRALSMSNSERVCPVCGSKVRRGLTTCATCQHDFAAAHQS